MFAEGEAEAHVEELLQLLHTYGWLTRRALKQIEGWSERTTRAIAEAAGDRVVRGPRGFNAFEKCSLDEIEHCAAIAEGQGNKMINYALALRKRAHRRLA